MPANRGVNSQSGVYGTACCKAEILIPEESVIPDCPNHQHLPTEWKYVEDDQIRHVTHYFPKKNLRPKHTSFPYQHMKIDDQFGGHIPLRMLWEVRTKVRLFTREEVAHFVDCDR